MMHARPWTTCALLVVALMSGCGGNDDENEAKACSIEEQSGCDSGNVCEEVVGGDPQCFAPIAVKGRVFDTASAASIAGARVVARDANDAAVSAVAVSDEMGNYSLNVPVPRDANGVPQKTENTSYTLRADAAGYQAFPMAPRVALPVDVTKAANNVVQASTTDIALVPLPDASGLGSVSGKVNVDQARGTLVVAGGVTGVADRDGNYTVFNVPAGDVEVRGYKQGFNLKPATASVSADATTSNVNLELLGTSTAVVSGKIEIVNPGAGKDTSVILALEDTFNEMAARGEAPPGLRVGDVTGDFTISGVPDGRYVVLAAFENDSLVRDPDTSIGGTDIVRIEVVGANEVLDEGFKVTGALDVVSPDNEAPVSGTPSFVWKDDSSEKSYDVELFDAYGVKVWSKTGLPSVSGGGDVTVQYDGPSLTAGQIYQFRAISLSRDGVPISRTEDLRGVFLYQ